MDRMIDQIHLTWLFDYLIYNLDRRTHNLMMAPGWDPILIDQSMSFANFQEPIRPLYRFPREFVDRLRELELRTLQKTLKRYLRRDQIMALWGRRNRILQIAGRQAGIRGKFEVFFPLPSSGSKEDN